MQTTTNYGFKKPEGTDTVDIADLNYNADTTDSALTPTADPSLTPTGNGPGKLVQWVGWMTNRIKAITGGTYWYSAPATTLAAAKAHADAAAPHSGHETPAGAQAKVDTHAGDYTLQIPYAGTTTNVGNAYSITTPAISALTAGMAISVKINADSTGAATLNWNSKGAKAIYKANGVAVSNLKAGGIYTLRYDGVNFILQGEGASGNATASDLLSGKTATVDAGEIVGTMPDWDSMFITPGATDRTIPKGYHNGAGIVIGDADLVAGNIKNGVNIFGVTGTYDPTNKLTTKNYVVDTGQTIADSDLITLVNNKVRKYQTGTFTRKTFPFLLFTSSGSPVIDPYTIKLTDEYAIILFGVTPDYVYGVGVKIVGNAITFGTPLQLTTAQGAPLFTGIKVNTYKILVATPNSSTDKTYMCAVSLNTTTLALSKGTTVSVNNDSLGQVGLAYLTTDKAVLSYSNPAPYAVVVTLSGNTITLGTPLLLDTGSALSTNACGISADKVLVVYHQTGFTSYGVILTVNGTTLSKGTATAVLTDTSGYSYFNGLILLSDTKAAVTVCNYYSSYTNKIVVFTFDSNGITSVGTDLFLGYNINKNNTFLWLDNNNKLRFPTNGADGDITHFYTFAISGTSISIESDITARKYISGQTMQPALMGTLYLWPMVENLSSSSGRVKAELHLDTPDGIAKAAGVAGATIPVVTF